MKSNINKISLFLAAMVTFGGSAASQVTSPCPEVLINEKYDHVPLRQYRVLGWDTVVSCEHPSIELTAEPYIPVQFFNGTYTVEEIPFNPPDTTFYLGYSATTDANNPYKKKLAISNDDDWAPAFINIAYPFYFFGIRKSTFLLGDNGIVTFANGPGITAGGNCPYATTTPLPWPSSVPSSPSCNPALMRDAIYGVYEDTYTGSNGSYMSGTQGIYYGVLDEYPCRKIICSWNQIPVFNDQNKRQTYQIVCYEGSNIIEVHVKRRNCCSSTNSGMGTIGIQNATGQPQVKGQDRNDPNYYVVNGSPASFTAPGWNPKTATQGTYIENIAYRFTPQGTTTVQSYWFRLLDNGDSIPLPRYVDSDPTTYNALDDTNGYYVPMPQVLNPNTTSGHPTLTRAVIRPSSPSRYVVLSKFKNANGDWYDLYDTIVVGVDTANDMTLTLAGGTQSQSNHMQVKKICQGHTASASVTWPASQEAQNITWNVVRKLNGQEITLPNSIYGVDGSHQNLTLLSDPRFDTLPLNKIDTVYIQVTVDFMSGCSNYDRAMVLVYPNFDTTEHHGICRGQTFHWAVNNTNYTQTTNTPQAVLQSQPGCDSIVHLDLTVFDVSLTDDYIMDCKPITWLNGHTYSQSNDATYETDTIVLPNRYNCDSIVRLRFTIHPLTAKIKSDLDHFDLDHLDVVLTDMSIGNDSRRWSFMPQATEQTGATAYYTIPVEADEATIKLTAFSPYGCIDSTQIVLPLQKEHFWVPNAFTPDRNEGNNTFSSVSTLTVQQEMYIYNRFGEMVFHCEGVDCGWDGRDLDGKPCPQGAYVYVIRYTNIFEPDVTRIKKGSVTLIR